MSAEINNFGHITIRSENHEVQYEADSITGGGMLFLKHLASNKATPIFHRDISAVIAALKRGQALLDALEP